MQIWNLLQYSTASHQLKHKYSWFYLLYAPCPHIAYVCTCPGPLQPAYTSEDRVSKASRLFPSRSLILKKIWCVHEILLTLSFSEYIFNHSQEIHTKDALTRSSPSTLQKIISQEDLHLSTKRISYKRPLLSYLYFHPLGHLTYFPYFRVNHFP